MVHPNIYGTNIGTQDADICKRRIHFSESNIMMLNVMALVFNRMPEQAPFFMKPLLRAISKKAETGASISY
jgi:hypothetical protein